MPGSQARGVTGALEFLREAGLGRPVRTGQKVLVIGGGNTASDAARSAIRLGGGTATIVSLEAEDELAIVPEDLEQARDEGVLFAPNTSCVRVLSRGRARDRRRALPGPAGQGRERARCARRSSPGTEREVDCDTILIAIGQVQQLDWLPEHLSATAG